MTSTSCAKMSGTFNKSFTLGAALAWFGVLLAILLLGAHYYRAGNYLMTACLAVLILLHFGTASWKRLVIGSFLAWGAVEWANSVFDLINLRIFMGTPWLRGALILAVVGLLTLLAAIHTLAKGKKLSPGESSETVTASAVAFIMVFGILYMLRLRNPDVLLLERFLPVWGACEITVLAWYAAVVAGGLMSPGSRKVRRAAWLLFSIIFFAQMALGLTVFQELRSLENAHIPIPGMVVFASVYRGEIGFMPFLVLGAALLAGSAWCGMLCYFGPIESAFSGRKIIRQPSPFLRFALSYGRIASLAAGVVIALLLRLLDFQMATAIWFGIGFAAISLIVILLASRKYAGMSHCSTFCPLGLIINILGRLSPWRIKIDRDKCDNCGTCEKICAYRAIDAQSRQKGTASCRCSLCRDCLPACHKSAISLTFPFMNSKIAELVFIIIVVTLHAVFIATARPL